MGRFAFRLSSGRVLVGASSLSWMVSHLYLITCGLVPPGFWK